MPEQRETHEEILGRLNRRLRTLYQCINTFVQAESEQELLQSTCDILVAGGEVRLAWIGYCEDDAEKTVRPVAQAGDGLGRDGKRSGSGRNRGSDRQRLLGQ